MIASFAFIAGLVFGIGLIVSGLVNPAKVLGFLDLAGRWDPSLAFVMCSAIAIGGIAFYVAGRRSLTLLGTSMLLPTARAIDRRLIFGSVLFGVGWGLAGFCPGPALVAIGAGYMKALVFVAAMIAGMLAFEWIERARTRVADGAGDAGGGRGAAASTTVGE